MSVAHIFFDDAMELDDDDKWVVNKFVRNISDCLSEASRHALFCIYTYSRKCT